MRTRTSAQVLTYGRSTDADVHVEDLRLDERARPTFAGLQPVARQLAGGGEPVFQNMLPWAAYLEQSGREVAGLPDEFWREPGR